MKLKFKNDNDFAKHINNIVNGSLYVEEGFSIGLKDNYLILQVCHYDPPDSYLLAICKEV